MLLYTINKIHAKILPFFPIICEVFNSCRLIGITDRLIGLIDRLIGPATDNRSGIQKIAKMNFCTVNRAISSVIAIIVVPASSD